MKGNTQNGRACCAGIVQVVEDWHTKPFTRSHTCLVTVDDIVIVYMSSYGTPNESIIDVTKSYAYFIRCCDYRLLLTFDVAIVDCFCNR